MSLLKKNLIIVIIRGFLTWYIKNLQHLAMMEKDSIQLNLLKNLTHLDIDFSKEYILEKLVKLKKEISIIITRYQQS